MKIKWITLFIGDMAKSLSFYKDILAFKIDKEIDLEDKYIIFLSNESDVSLELIYRKSEDYKASENNNFSFGVEVEALESIVEQLKDEGYRVKGPIQPPSSNPFYFVTDPDGFSVQLL